jgi:hypothetical protein
MILDHAILLAAIAAVVLALYGRSAVLLALLIAFNHLSNLTLYVAEPSWQQLEGWLYALIVKDLILITAFGFMRSRQSFILMLSFVATCLLHQLILAQALTGVVDNLTALAHRSELMKFVVIAQLSTVYHAILTGGDSGGGKLAKFDLLNAHRRVSRFFYMQAFKVEKT